jgi:hypothetical protein
MLTPITTRGISLAGTSRQHALALIVNPAVHAAGVNGYSESKSLLSGPAAMALAV